MGNRCRFGISVCGGVLFILFLSVLWTVFVSYPSSAQEMDEDALADMVVAEALRVQNADVVGNLAKEVAALKIRVEGLEVANTIYSLTLEGKMKMVTINHVGGEYRLSFGDFGGKIRQEVVLKEYSAVRAQLFKLLLTQDFKHLTILFVKAEVK